MGLTTPHSKKLIVTKVEQRNKLDRFNDDGHKRTRYTDISVATQNVQTMLQPGKMKEIMETRQRGRPTKGWREEAERDLQVLGVRRWRELVIDREKWKSIVRQAKAHQRAVAPMEEEEEEEEGNRGRRRRRRKKRRRRKRKKRKRKKKEKKQKKRKKKKKKEMSVKCKVVVSVLTSLQ
jgi:hypothetical protein